MASRDGDPDRRLRKTSIAWSYFTLVDEEKHIAACNTCDAHMSFRSSISNLMKHIKRKHKDIEARISDDEKESESEVEEPSKLNLLGDEEKLPSSLVWEHFEITNSEKKIASCSVCQVPLSFKNSVQVLLKHLRRKHNIGEDVVLLSEDEEKKMECPPSSYRSAIWPYFNVTDVASKSARCLVCKKLLSYNTGTSNLRKHLQRKHPLIKLPGPGEERKTIILSSGDQLYEFETTKGENENEEEDLDDTQNEPIAIDEVFLDEFNGSMNRIETEKKYKPKKRKRKNEKKLLLEQTSDSEDEIVFKKRYVKKEQDSIDLFSRYIASLLKELPRAVSNQLQKEFVKQIMNAQLEFQSMSHNPYSITITNDSAAAPENVDIFRRFRGRHDTKGVSRNSEDGCAEDANTSFNVWSYYEKKPNGQARCAVCRDTVPKGSLRDHLREHHPKLVAEINLGSEDEAWDSQEDAYTEIVYLEDEVKNAQSIEKSECKKRPSSSSDEELVKIKAKKTNPVDEHDEIEQFGKYVTCLLKKVPHEACLELQMEIVNLIMNKQLEIQRKKSSESAGKLVERLRSEINEATQTSSKNCDE